LGKDFEQVKVYISGPMTGIPEFNYPAFEAAEKIVSAAGYDPVSPHRAPKLETWKEYMRYDIKLLMDCQAIAMLPGWENSKGANIEFDIANRLDFYIWGIHEGELRQ
jgi:hypothetical protein